MRIATVIERVNVASLLPPTFGIYRDDWAVCELAVK